MKTRIMHKKDNSPTCACCGHKTIGHEYDICPICMWQCDFSQEKDPDSKHGPNSFTLRQSQQNFMKFGNCDGVKDINRASKEKYERDPQWCPLPPNPDPIEDTKAWRRIRPPLEPDACLCCGYATIFHEGEVCRICHWPSGYRSDPYMRYPGINEGLSLYEAQQNYQKLGVFSEKYLHLKTEPRPDDIYVSSWKPADPPSDPSQFKNYIAPSIEFCPCCGYRTCRLQVCDICRWHRNEEQERNPDSLPTDKNCYNDVTFRQARQNFLAFGKCSKKYVIDDPELRKHIRKYAPDPDDERDPNWKPLPPLSEDS